MNTIAANNALTLEREIEWFADFLDTRFSNYFERTDLPLPRPPDLEDDRSGYATFVNEFDMGVDERLVLMLALLPEIRPHALDAFLIRNKAHDGMFSEFGGYQSKRQGGFQPTLGTAAFLRGGNALKTRFEFVRLLDADHFFRIHGILDTDQPVSGERLLDARLAVTPETLSRVTSGSPGAFRRSHGIPAQLITTQLGWDDVVLSPEVLDDIEALKAWIQNSRKILDEWGLGPRINPGYRALFYGPSGTGKTLAATLIGATVGSDVYRIDLSMLVSKFIGETEKNLSRFFNHAEKQEWILFFDEADALFGKRTRVSTSNERFANQEVSFLLQRIEDYSGVVILAGNARENIDDAVARRFQLLVHFPIPGPELRLQLWRQMVGEQCPLEDDVNLEEIAQRYELSGGTILNVLHYGATKAVQYDRRGIRRVDLIDGIRRELEKFSLTSK